MNDQRPTVLLVHGAFAESASWNGVVERLQQRSIDVLAVANPLRSVASDAAFVRDVVAHVGGPVILVGHSYGGFVITQAAADNPDVVALVYVCAFAPDHGENAFDLSLKFPGSTLGDALDAFPGSTGVTELLIRRDAFHDQFAADVPAAEAAVMGATQRSVTQEALVEGLPTDRPAWRTLPSWFVFGELDRNIPAELHRYLADRANARGTVEVPGASHALSVSDPEAVTASILDAVEGWVQQNTSEARDVRSMTAVGAPTENEGGAR